MASEIVADVFSRYFFLSYVVLQGEVSWSSFRASIQMSTCRTGDHAPPTLEPRGDCTAAILLVLSD
jgi:hypothetical protein